MKQLITVFLFIMTALPLVADSRTYSDLKKQGYYARAAELVLAKAADADQRLTALRLYGLSDDVSAAGLIAANPEALQADFPAADVLMAYVAKKVYAERHDFAAAARWGRGFIPDRLTVYAPRGNIAVSGTAFSAPEGFFDLTDYADDTGVRGALWYRADTDGEFLLTIGRSGDLAITVNDTALAELDERVVFFPAQREIRISLTAGVHRIGFMLKRRGDDRLRLALAVRGAGSFIASETTSGTIAGHAAVDQFTKLSGFDHAAARVLSGHRDSTLFNSLESIGLSDPDFAESRYLLGEASEEPERKDQYYEAALLGDRNHIEAAVGRILIRIRAGRLPEAWSLLERYTAGRPFSSLLETLRARLLMESGMYVAAADQIARMRGNGMRYEAVLVAAILARREGDASAATAQAEQALALRRTRAAADLLLVTNPSLRPRTLERLEAMFPEDISLRLDVAEALLLERRPAEAMVRLLAVQSRMPWNARAAWLMAERYRLEDAPLARELALQYYAAAAKADPSSARYRTALEELRGATAREPLLNRALRLDPVAMSAAAAGFAEPVIVLLDENIFRLYDDGTVRELKRKWLRINDVENASAERVQSLFLDTGTDTMDWIDCRVIRDGVSSKVHRITRTNISDPESRLYYSYDSVSADFGHLNDGDVLLFEYAVTRKGTPGYEGYFGRRVYFDREQRLVRGRSLVIAPKRRSISTKVYMASEKISRTVEGDLALLDFSISELLPVKREKSMPHFSAVDVSVAYSSFTTWKEFHRWYAGLLKGRSSLTGEMKTVVDGLIKGKSDAEKIDAIYRYVIDRTRYVGFELGTGSVQPRRSDAVFSSRLGDCKDSALLLAAMLRHAGFESDLTLIRTRDRGAADFDFPFIGNFNHAIAWVRHEGDLFLDGTVKHAGMRDLPQTDRDVEVLVIAENGARIVRVDGSRYSPNAERITNRIQIRADGSAELTRRMEKQGDQALSIRGDFAEMDRKRDELDKYWNYYFPGSKIGNIAADAVKDTYWYDVLIPGLVTRANGYLVIPVSLIPDGMLNRLKSLPVRENDYIIPNDYRVSQTMEIELPEGVKPERLPRDVRHRWKNDSYVVTCRQKSEHIVEITIELIVHARRIPAGEYPEYLSFILRSLEAGAQRILAVHHEK